MADRMIIKHNGRIGIGTTSPSGILHVVDNNASSPAEIHIQGSNETGGAYSTLNLIDNGSISTIKSFGQRILGSPRVDFSITHSGSKVSTINLNASGTNSAIVFQHKTSTSFSTGSTPTRYFSINSTGQLNGLSGASVNVSDTLTAEKLILPIYEENSLTLSTNEPTATGTGADMWIVYDTYTAKYFLVMALSSNHKKIELV